MSLNDLLVPTSVNCGLLLCRLQASSPDEWGWCTSMCSNTQEWRGTISVHVKSESNWTRAYKQNIYSGGLRTWSLYLYVDNCSRRTIMVLWETTASVWFLVDWCRESYWVFIFGLVDFCAFDLFNYSLLVLFVPMSRPCGLLSWGALWNICVLEHRPIPG